VGCGGGSGSGSGSGGPFSGHWSCQWGQTIVVGTLATPYSESTTLVITSNADGTLSVTDANDLVCPMTFTASGDHATGETRSCVIGTLPVQITTATMTVSGHDLDVDIDMTTTDVTGTSSLLDHYSCSM
jgi:hypothetical protein